MLTKPATQDRLNAAVVEVLGLNVMGPVGIPGTWDVGKTVLYIQSKLKEPLALYSTHTEGITQSYHTEKKRIYFTESGVFIYPLKKKTRQTKWGHDADYALHAPVF